MLTPDIKDKVLAFVRKEPRTMNDIAKLIGRSWLTADSYVARLREDTGLLEVKTFRGGTRGALKVVYWNYVESLGNEELKKELFERIRLGQKKQDFDFLDIYQYVDKSKKRCFSETYTNVHVSKKQNLVSLFNSAEHEILCFAGNLSWINVIEGKNKISNVLAEVAERKIPIKIMGRVDLASVKNVDRIGAINSGLGREGMELRHRRQPLRGFIIDSKVARFKLEEEKAGLEQGELESNTRIFFEIYDPEWIEWLKKVFWALYRTAVPAKRRIDELETV